MPVLKTHANYLKFLQSNDRLESDYPLFNTAALVTGSSYKNEMIDYEATLLSNGTSIRPILSVGACFRY